MREKWCKHPTFYDLSAILAENAESAQKELSWQKYAQFADQPAAVTVELRLKNTPDAFLGRQPILDRNGRIFAYELLFRSGDLSYSGVTNDIQATSCVISHVFDRFGVTNVLGSHLGFINVDADALFGTLLDRLPSGQVVLELLETVVITPQLVARCEELKNKGFKLALDDFIFTADFLAILPLVDFIKIDLQAHGLDELAAIVTHLRQWPAQLLAEKVDTPSLAEYCTALGFDLFQGYHYERPSVISDNQRQSPII